VPRASRPKPSSRLRKRPRQQRAIATFDAILEAAARILVEDGAERLGTNAIAARAGISIGSLYQYFPNRAAIVRALLAREVARAERRRPALLDDPASPLAARLRAAVDWRFDVHAADPALARALQLLIEQHFSAAERERFADERVARVRATLSGAPDVAADRDLGLAAFLLDVFLESATDAVTQRRPEWLGSAALRAEIVQLFARHLAADDVTPAPPPSR
jgi:AcrR family transcriptional regulator